MKINYSYYKIDTSDIKDYERSLILLNKTSDKLGLKILNKIEAKNNLIIKFYTVDTLVDGRVNQGYWSSTNNKTRGMV
jgi:hypothetical protein